MDQGSNPGAVVGIEGQIMVHRYMYLLGVRLTTSYLPKQTYYNTFVAILFWDYIITFGDEINYIWTRPKILSSYCFLLIRYVALLGEIPVTVVKFSMMSTSVCMRYYSYWIVWVMLRALIVYGSLCLRIYALYERSRRILVIMIIATLLFTGISTWQGLDQDIARVEFHPEGCLVTVPLDTVFPRLIPWILVLAFDSLIFSLTLWKSWSMRHYHGLNAQVSDPLIVLLFRDGAVYYALLLLATLANIVTYYASGAYTTEPLSTFAFNISATMVSRMLLNLHKSVDEGILSSQRLHDIDFVPTMSWSSASPDLDRETVSSLRRRSWASRSIVTLDSMTEIDDEIEIEGD